MPRDYIVTPDSSRKVMGKIAGSVTVPGDKSISHRAAIIAALGEGDVFIHGFLESEDCLGTLNALRALGIDSRKSPQTCREPFLVVSGKGLCGLSRPSGAIDCGNSGTAMRLLAGMLAAQPFASELIGDDSLMQRPMRRIADPLNEFGTMIATSPGGTPPIRISPSRRKLQAIHYGMPVASAQVKSALLLAGLCAGVPVEITEPDISRDHTERMLAAFGVPLQRDGNTLRMTPVPRLSGPDVIDVPGDLSSAAFFLVLAAILPSSDIRLRCVGTNPTRDGVLRLLERMDAAVTRNDEQEGRGGEPLADLRGQYAKLHAIDIDADDVALAIDEIPVLLVAAACASGTTRLRGAAELRVKESDRLTAMAAGLRALGIQVAEYPDGLDVTGGVLQGGEVDSHGDHRIAMAFAVAAAVASGPVRIRNIDNVATSYPAFRRDMAALGIDIRETEGTA